MSGCNVAVLGHQFSDPRMWVWYVSDRFHAGVDQVVVHQHDRALETVVPSVSPGPMTTRAVLNAVWDRRATYGELVRWADVVLYMMSRLAEHQKLNAQDNAEFAAAFDNIQHEKPVITLLNDSFCGTYAGAVLDGDEIDAAVHGEIARFETAIGSRPNSEVCRQGAGDVFRALAARMAH